MKDPGYAADTNNGFSKSASASSENPYSHGGSGALPKVEEIGGREWLVEDGASMALAERILFRRDWRVARYDTLVPRSLCLSILSIFVA